MRTAYLSMALICAVLVASATAATLEGVPLQWRPTSHLQLGAMQMSQVPIEFETFQDVRESKGSIGENDEDAKPRLVTTHDDVGAFVSTRMRELFDQAGLKTVDHQGDVVIKGEVTQFFVRETSLYKSEVDVRLTVSARDGRTLWHGLVSGDATRFGRSYKLENYYEVLSDAIVNTVSSMLQSAELQLALSGH